MVRRKFRKLSKKEAKAKIKTDGLALENKKKLPQFATSTQTEKQILEIPENILVRDLSAKMNVPVTILIKSLMKNGVLKNINETIDWETAAIAGDELGYEVKLKIKNEKVKTEIKEEKADAKDLIERPPIVTVMGHVDHGKTKLLDAIRKTDVIATESGGITQHIGAYQITFKKKKITFIDTPGHEAFEAMRAHGANITDIVVLVVAADDGIKPQTEEAYEHAKRAGVPVIVAINKIDLPGANIIRTKQQLTEIGLIPEDMGGKTITVPLSAKENQHINDLLNMILLLSEMKQFRANPKKTASAIVVESHLDSNLGPVAHILVQSGTLKKGDFVVVGQTWGKIRLMEDEYKNALQSAEPSKPVKIAGLKELPFFGDALQVVPDEKTAKIVLSDFKKAIKITDKDLSKGKKVIPIVLKADALGSLKAIKDSLKKLETDEVAISIAKEGAGDLSDDDVMMAATAKARVICFKSNVPSGIQKLIESENVTVTQYNVIYDLIDDLKETVAFLMRKEIEVKTARAHVLKIFHTAKSEKIVGIKVLSGKIQKNEKAIILHDDKKIGEGKVLSLQIEKDKVAKLETGKVGGIRMSYEGDIAEGDELEFYKTELK